MADPLLARDPLVGLLLAAVGCLGFGGLIAVALDRQDLTLAWALAGGGLLGLAYTRVALTIYTWGRLSIRQDGGVVYDPVRFGILVAAILLPFLLLGAAFVVGRLMLTPDRQALLAQMATGSLLAGFFVGAGLYYVRPPDR